MDEESEIVRYKKMGGINKKNCFRIFAILYLIALLATFIFQRYDVFILLF
ncbi:hypothetical protein C5S31_08030 [ANME-1 cluster archaeon GoMg2]|nr:hypothetical protein [ANME-1 cluster archaeon GoMg2]